ncbi:MAG TPA: signal peptidase II [Geminicoccaceae bacterium]|nr:signal peptidase II [Geminicoccaceae bacterium]
MRLPPPAVVALVLLLDQTTKWAALVWLDPFSRVELTPFFNLVLVWNPGVSFGMLREMGELGPWLLTALAVLISVGLVVWLRRERRPAARTALALILGGAVGNIVDRLRFGAVVDFLDFHAFGYHWPAFNVADSAIVIGAGVLLVDSLLVDRANLDKSRGKIDAR